MSTKIDADILKEVIWICLEADIPLMIHGATGIGKSSIVREVAGKWANHLREGKPTFSSYLTDHFIDFKDYQYCFKDLRLAHMDIADWGIPIIDNKNGSHRKTRPNWLPVKEPGQPDFIYVLFADEMNRGTVEAVNGMMSITAERELHDFKLPKVSRLLSACNPPTGVFTAEQLDEAMKARWCHVHYELTDQCFVQERKHVLSDLLSEVITKAGFLSKTQGNQLGNWSIDKEYSPCPRTIEMAARLEAYIGWFKSINNINKLDGSEFTRCKIAIIKIADSLLGPAISKHWQQKLGEGDSYLYDLNELGVQYSLNNHISFLNKYDSVRLFYTLKFATDQESLSYYETLAIQAILKYFYTLKTEYLDSLMIFFKSRKNEVSSFWLDSLMSSIFE